MKLGGDGLSTNEIYDRRQARATRERQAWEWTDKRPEIGDESTWADGGFSGHMHARARNAKSCPGGIKCGQNDYELDALGHVFILQNTQFVGQWPRPSQDGRRQVCRNLELRSWMPWLGG